MSDQKKKAALEAARLGRKYGHKTGAVGSDEYKLKAVPTGSLALDYALGTGGWPLGHPVEIFGAPDIGKSSVLGFSALRNAQKQNLLCGIIALEPAFDKEWAFKNGVDPEATIIARPDSGEIAFEILHEWVQDDIVDFVVFDSIGALVTEGEREEGAKSRVGGQSKLITDGVKRILMPTWKHGKGVILLNQQRDDMNSRISGMKESPGGNALHHSAAIRVHLKPTGSPTKERINGEDVVTGRTLVAVIKRNKLSEGSSKRAEFDFCQMDTDESEVGIDIPKDVLSTAIRAGVISKAGAWFNHPLFPGEKSQLQGKDAAYEFLLENPSAVEQIRNEVIDAMFLKQGEAKIVEPVEVE